MKIKIVLSDCCAAANTYLVLQFLALPNVGVDV